MDPHNGHTFDRIDRRGDARLLRHPSGLHGSGCAVTSDRKIKDLPSEEQSREWYQQIHTYETPHKTLSDWGRGLIAAAIGLAMASSLLFLYERRKALQRPAVLFTLWFGLWAILIPFSVWYYLIRFNRFDYPVWADSIAIPIVGEVFSSIIGAGVSLALLRLLLVHHPLPTHIRFTRPRSMAGWLRGAFIVLWLFVLLVCVVSCASDGDEGRTFSCLVASAILLIFLAAPETKSSAPGTSEAEPTAPIIPASRQP